MQQEKDITIDTTAVTRPMSSAFGQTDASPFNVRDYKNKNEKIMSFSTGIKKPAMELTGFKTN